MEEFFAALGMLIVAGGGGAAVAVGAFKFLGGKWLEDRFQRRLEAFRHEHNKELVALRHQIDMQFNRFSKIHEKEIQVLPEVWVRLSKAHQSIVYLASPGRTYEDVGRLNDAQLEYFLTTTSFAEWEKNELRASTSRMAYYLERMKLHERADAGRAYREFATYFMAERIFINDELKILLKEIDDKFWECLVFAADGQEYGDRAMVSSARERAGALAPLVDAVEVKLKERLRVAAA